MDRRKFLSLFGKGAAAAAAMPLIKDAPASPFDVVEAFESDNFVRPVYCSSIYVDPVEGTTEYISARTQFTVLDNRDLSIISHQLDETYPELQRSFVDGEITAKGPIHRSYMVEVYYRAPFAKNEIDYMAIGDVHLLVYDPSDKDILLAEFDAVLTDRQLSAAYREDVTVTLHFEEIH